MLKNRFLLPASFALLLAAVMVLANQDWGAYDTGQTLILRGPLKEVRYENPQARVSLDYQGKEWTVVLGPLSRLESRGMTSTDLKPGRPVTLVGHPRKDGAPELRAERIVLDGRTLELR